jgi:hypothetical protein
LSAPREVISPALPTVILGAALESIHPLKVADIRFDSLVEHVSVIIALGVQKELNAVQMLTANVMTCGSPLEAANYCY